GGQARRRRGMDHWRSPARNQDRQIRRTVGGHMQRHVFLLAMIIGAAPLAAQEPQCNNIPFPGATAACNTAVDGVRAFYPLAGMIVTGGNPVLGTARATGGLGHLTLTARVHGMKAALPDPTAANQSGVPSSFNVAVPAPPETSSNSRWISEVTAIAPWRGGSSSSWMSPPESGSIVTSRTIRTSGSMTARRPYGRW